MEDLRDSGWIRDATGQIILLSTKQPAGMNQTNRPNVDWPMQSIHVEIYIFSAHFRDPLTFLYSAVCQNHRMCEATLVLIETSLFIQPSQFEGHSAILFEIVLANRHHRSTARQ